MANDDYDAMVNRLRQLTSEVASSLRVVANKENFINEVMAILVTKQADLQIIKEQMEFMRRPDTVASLNAWRDLWTEYDLYQSQIKKIIADLTNARTELRIQSQINTRLKTEFKTIENRIAAYGKILVLPCLP